MSNPATDIATALQTAGHGTLGTDIYVGPSRPQKSTTNVPDETLFVIPTSGIAPSLHAGVSDDIRYPSVMIMVRSTPGKYSTGYTLAKAAFETIHDADLSGYISCLAEQSEPMYLGTDEQGLHNWSINFGLMVRGTR